MVVSGAAGSVGAKLREARERRGLSLRQIADVTKISVLSLQALERDELSRLPGGIFCRAIIRSYAGEVGLDPESTVEEFLARCSDESVAAGHPNSERAEYESVGSHRRAPSSVLWVGVAGVLSIAAIGTMLYLKPSEQPTVAADLDGGIVTRPAQTVLQPLEARELPVSLMTRRLTGSDPFTVELLATGPCWVSVIVDGESVVERLLQAGERQRVEVHRNLVLTAGDAAALVVTINGVDARPLGTAGEVVTTTVTLANLEDFLTPL